MAKLHSPSLEELFDESAQLPPATESPRAETLSLPEQEALLQSLKDALTKAEPESDKATFEGVPGTLSKLWHSQSGLLLQATEALANGSRNPAFRLAYGQVGILSFFLRLIASREVTDSSLILHCLRLIGNSCADTDENRATVVNDNYTFAILRHLLRPGLIQVVIPVIYNLCIDYEPAQSQLAANKIVYILLRLLEDEAFQGNDALIDYAYELIELVGEKEQGIESSPDGTLSLLVALALKQEAPAQFSILASCIAAYLNNIRYHNLCISKGMTPDILSLLKRSPSSYPSSPSDETQAHTQARLKVNQAMAELSASPLFAETYPLDSPLSQTLKAWLNSSDDQLQICACIMLGNLARSDEVCITMVRDLKIHEDVIGLLNSNARGAALHAAVGFLKNLAIASDNRLRIGEAGILPAIARLWAFETIPQVQLVATSITRQLIISSIENISRLLEPVAPSSDNRQRTYLSILLALFEKTDSTPIKTEIGRIIASLCRTLVPKSKNSEEADSSADALLDTLFTRHEGIAHPLGAMVTQTQWPVVRSEGWFAFALMASTQAGAEAVISGLQSIDGLSLIEQSLSSEEHSEDNETEKVQWRKDRDNIVVLVQELLKNKNELATIDAAWRSKVQDLIRRHVSQTRKEGN
ncbi:putative GTP binding protein [Aspergillus undulatus]|uniref:putative GTP binding protein n=1 Tax=Aspergillus undulatus TaxID=1810928 RepID=UPI003CCC946E